MARNDNPHALRLAEALRTVLGEEAAERVSLEHPLSKSADADRKYQWARSVCACLDSTAGADEVRQIRRACRCGDGRTMAQEIASCIARAGSLQEGCALFSQKNRYAFLEYVSNRELRFGYHACVCSCVKRAEGLLPLTWCECSCGYAEAMFRQVFGEAVQVELLGSTKAGDDRCAMRIRIP
ncbi:MAG: hypothetical protein E7327_07535 [Clostridiales bacterium]|nr:hypothetical protein [Clostridiales bacterium]